MGEGSNEGLSDLSALARTRSPGRGMAAVGGSNTYSSLEGWDTGCIPWSPAGPWREESWCAGGLGGPRGPGSPGSPPRGRGESGWERVSECLPVTTIWSPLLLLSVPRTFAQEMFKPSDFQFFATNKWKLDVTELSWYRILKIKFETELLCNF